MTWGAVLEQDSLDGAVAEELRLSNPPNGTYTVAIGAYVAAAPIEARIRVRIGSRVAYEDSRILNEGDQWLPISWRVQNGAVTATVINAVGQQAGMCWGRGGPVVPGTGGFGDSCAEANDCRDGLNCATGICGEFCAGNSDCDVCADENGTCSCTVLAAGIGFCSAA